MNARALVADQLYFGVEPLVLTLGAARTLRRLATMPLNRARVDAEMLRQDFQLDRAATQGLVRGFVASGVLEPEPGSNSEYRVTGRLREFAQARIVPPLSRAEARQVLERASEVAQLLNADLRNPLVIERLAVSGAYMSSSDRIGKLHLWPIVSARTRGARRPALSESECAHEIRAALREISPHVFAQVVADTGAIERPFGVPFEAGADAEIPAPSGPSLRGWAATVRRRLADR